MLTFRLAALVASIAALPSLASADETELHGTYRLVSTTQRIVDTGQVETFTNENGFINYGREGRMFVLIVRGNRPKAETIEKMTDQQRADLFRSMAAYTGTYRFDGKSVQHHIDASWNELWTGTTQVRYVKREGDKLILTTPPIARPQDGKKAVTTLVWEKTSLSPCRD